jgi:hypothetical protein
MSASELERPPPKRERRPGGNGTADLENDSNHGKNRSARLREQGRSRPSLTMLRAARVFLAPLNEGGDE